MSKHSPKDHYVQQIFYENFSVEYSKKHINIYDKISREIRLKQPIRDIASETGFFHVDFNKYRNWVIKNQIYIEKEKFEFVIENVIPDFIDVINSDFIETNYIFIKNLINEFSSNEKTFINFINSNNFEIQKEQISYYILMQFLKTRSAKEKLLDFINKQNNSEVPKISINEEITKLIHARSFFDPKSTREITSRIFHCFWVFGISDYPFDFFTSDNPVIIESNTSFNEIIFPKDFKIFYPISPNIVIIIYSSYAEFPFCYYPFRNSLIKIPDTFVTKINQLQIINAKRTIGFKNLESVEQIKKLENFF